LKPSSLTITSNVGLLRTLISETHISPAFTPGDTSPPGEVYQAIWDTGATGTVITQKVVDECGLKPIGFTIVHTAGGKVENCPEYLIAVGFQSGVRFSGIRATLGKISDHQNVLIGMDIITQGDFVITNHGGNTVCSFRVPSCEKIDFVEQHNKTNLKAAIKKTLPN